MKPLDQFKVPAAEKGDAQDVNFVHNRNFFRVLQVFEKDPLKPEIDEVID
jgi:hypothetical protein